MEKPDIQAKKGNREVIALDQLIAKVRAETPSAFGKIEDVAASRMLRAVFLALSKELTAREEGQIQVPGLGHFTIRAVVRKSKEEGGEPSTQKRIVYRGAKPPAKKASV